MDDRGRAATEDEPGYGIGAVARRLGVPAPTLRTWNLRYGIGPSRRTSGGHRRYDTDDLRRLEEMNRLIRSGVPAADAAREVLSGRAVPPIPVTGLGGPRLAPRPRPRPQIPTPAMMTRAAVALDDRAVSEWIGAALDRHGIMWTWERLVLPVFASICGRQAETGAGVEVEHLFSDRVMAALTRLAEPPADPVNERPVLLACAAEEQHCLPVYALAAALAADHRVATRVLGARTPYAALGDAMRRLGPAVVFVWSQRPETGDPAPLASLPALRPPSRVVVGGGGWWGGLPAQVSRVASFSEALSLIGSSLR